jgi:general stress protein 26
MYVFNQNDSLVMDNQKIYFLQERIKNLGSAIFFNQSDAVLRLPTSIVRITHVDDDGYLWFFMQKPQQQLNEFEKEFPVKLDFFRKGLDYSLQVIGKACIINDPEEIATITTHIEEVSAAARQYHPDKLMLIKVKMTRADYFESMAAQRANSWFHSAWSAIQSWIFPHSASYGPVTFYPGMSEVS